MTLIGEATARPVPNLVSAFTTIIEKDRAGGLRCISQNSAARAARVTYCIAFASSGASRAARRRSQLLRLLRSSVRALFPLLAGWPIPASAMRPLCWMTAEFSSLADGSIPTLRLGGDLGSMIQPLVLFRE